MTGDQVGTSTAGDQAWLNRIPLKQNQRLVQHNRGMQAAVGPFADVYKAQIHIVQVCVHPVLMEWLANANSCLANASSHSTNSSVSSTSCVLQSKQVKNS